MTEPSQPKPSRWGNAIGPLVLGALMLLVGGPCVVSLAPGLSDPAGAALAWFAVMICLPLIAGGLGLVVLALSRAYGEPGRRPVWRTLTGWLLIAFSLAYLALPVWNDYRASGGSVDVGGLVMGLLLLAVPAGLTAWLGWTLARR